MRKHHERLVWQPGDLVLEDDLVKATPGVLLYLPLKKDWSDAAREAALALRRSRMKQHEVLQGRQGELFEESPKQKIQAKLDEAGSTPRAEMPQVPRPQHTAFRQWLQNKGYKVQRQETNPADLKPTQNELNWDTVNRLAERYKDVDPAVHEPLFVSKDDRILDGHHRWAAEVMNGVKSVAIDKIDAPTSKLVDLANEFTKGEGKIDVTAQSKRPTYEKVLSQNEQIDAAVDLNKSMRMMEAHTPGPNLAKFVLKHGSYFPISDQTYDAARDPPQECFKNATHDALSNPDRTYVEGYISVHGVPIHHAWTVDKAGMVHDSTIEPAKAVGAYFGVPFTTSYLSKSTIANGYYGLTGHHSRASAAPLLEGRMDPKEFKQGVLLDDLKEDVVVQKLKYADTVRDSIEDTSKIDTPERHRLRDHIVDALYNHNIANRSYNKQATIVLGLPGAGKSSAIAPLTKQGYYHLSADDAKEMIPEFAGGAGATAVHEESSMIARRVREKLVADGADFVWEKVDSPEKIEKDIADLKKSGYAVDTSLINVSMDTAKRSAIERYLNSNRYIAPSTIGDYGNTPQEAFDVAKKSGMIRNSEVWYREHGEAPKKVG